MTNETLTSREHAGIAVPPIIPYLLEWQQARNLTQAEMAVKAGMSREHYNDFLHGRRGLPVNALCQLYKLGIPAHVLLQDHTTEGHL